MGGFRIACLLAALVLRAPTWAAPQVRSDESARSAPSRLLDSGPLRAVSFDLLGRPPFAAERERWLGRELADLVAEILRGREFWERWTEEQLYYFLLIENFRPHSDRVLRIPDDLHERRIGVREAVHRITLSASFDQRNPGPDTFVTVVMEQLLGLTVQDVRRELEIGKRLYDGGEGVFLGRKGSSQADVVRIAIEGERFLTELVRREYRRMLRTDPPRRELAGWVRELTGDPLAYSDIVRGWMLGGAYEARLGEKKPQPNRLYVRAMYVDLMDRLPEPDEERRMRNALDGLSDPGPLRSVLARLLLDSGRAAVPAKERVHDPTEWVAGLFERLLGRRASDAELKTFVSSFHDPACRPATVVYAIMSHPEYHTY